MAAGASEERREEGSKAKGCPVEDWSAREPKGERPEAGEGVEPWVEQSP